MRKIFYLAILIEITLGCSHPKAVTPQKTIVRTDSIFLKEYVVKKMNDHEVRLISASDTITLFLENAYGFDERIVFIKHSKQKP